MRTSLAMRAVAAFAAALLFLPLVAEAAFAHGSASFGPPAMHGGVRGHGQAQGWRDGPRQSWSWRRQYGGNRYGQNGWFWNGGGFFWSSPYGFADTGGAGGGALVVVGAPTLSVFPGVPAGVADPSPQGGCVIHKLIYDGGGKYVGERQTSEC
jgi:hypothetical protein